MARGAAFQPFGPLVPVDEGTILAGKYRVERVLGRGGMGVVVAATHMQLDQRVALKFLLPDALDNGEVVERFSREARAAVKIQSEHVARVIDVGQLDNGLPYMVMEYLQGSDLSATLRAQDRLPIEDAVEYVLQACEAIAQAHALGIVHRDLKPANLFLTTRPDGTMSIKVLDFGISKLTVPGASSGPEMSLTRTSAIMGSPTYMSPEQLKASRDVDARADIWALGVVLFELLTGSTPFEAETMPMLCAAILTDPPATVRAFRPEVPADLEKVILRCLEKRPDVRFANVAELAAALAVHAPKRARLSAERCARILKTAGIQTAPLAPALSDPPKVEPPPADVAVSTAAAWSHAETGGAAPTPRSSRVGKAAIAAVIATAGVAAVAALRLRSPEPAAVTAPSSQVVVVNAVAPAISAASPEPPAPSAAPASPEPAVSKPETAIAAPRARAKAVVPAAPAAPPKAPAPEPQPPPAKKNPLQIDIK